MQAHITITAPALRALRRTGKGSATAFEIDLEDAGNPALRVTLVVTDPHEAGLLADALAEVSDTITDVVRQ